nr:hypothetical protein [Polymorphobacter sp.]
MLRAILIGLLVSPLALLALALLGWLAEYPWVIRVIIGIFVGVPVGLAVLSIIINYITGSSSAPAPLPAPEYEPYEREPPPRAPAPRAASGGLRAISLAAHMGMRQQYRGWRYVSRREFPDQARRDTEESPADTPPDT